MLPWPFRQLRALHDALAPTLCSVTGTSSSLERLRSDAGTYEFRESFHLYAVTLRPLSEEDARRFAAYLTRKQGPFLRDEDIPLVIALSGGHPGLLKRIDSILTDIESDPAVPLQGMVAELSGKRPIQQECPRLWDELEEQGQEGCWPSSQAVRERSMRITGEPRTPRAWLSPGKGEAWLS